MTTLNDYWLECLRSSFDERGIQATEEQLTLVVQDVQIARENESLAFYTTEPAYVGEIAHLESALRAERNKSVCRKCCGDGSIISYGGTLQFESECSACRGRGVV